MNDCSIVVGRELMMYLRRGREVKFLWLVEAARFLDMGDTVGKAKQTP